MPDRERVAGRTVNTLRDDYHDILECLGFALGRVG
jgi:hypothetical protein